jgi:hypothetical protein
MNSSPMSSTTITTRGRAASLECVDTAFPTRSAIVTRSCLAAVTPEPVLPTIVFRGDPRKARSRRSAWVAQRMSASSWSDDAIVAPRAAARARSSRSFVTRTDGLEGSASSIAIK